MNINEFTLDKTIDKKRRGRCYLQILNGFHFLVFEHVRHFDQLKIIKYKKEM